MIFKVIPGFYALIISFWMYHSSKSMSSFAVGIFAILLLELSHFSKQKVKLPLKQLNVLFDASVLMGIGYLVYIGLTNTNNLVFSIIQLMYSLQFLFLPITLLILYHEKSFINLNILFKGKHSNSESVFGRIDILYSFFWIFSAALKSHRSPNQFLISLLALFSAILLLYVLSSVLSSKREKNVQNRLRFMAYFSSTTLLFLCISLTMMKFYSFAGDYLLENLFSHRSYLDPFQANTDIGRIGRMKMESDIVLRVYGQRAKQPLLEKATYSKFNNTTWSNTKGDSSLTQFKLKRDAYRKFTENDSLIKEIIVGKQKSYFPVAESVKVVEQYAEKGHVVGHFSDYLPIVEEAMYATPQGAFTLKDFSGVFTYYMEHKDNFIKENIKEYEPQPEDFQIPNISEKTWIEIDKIITQLPDLKPETVANYFKQNYKYTLNNEDKSSLLDFFRARTGHCEYYATATALLYRRAGYASQYTIGYSIQEWNGFEKAFLVRKSDAHAWAKVWMDGKWVEVDSTPADWYVPKNQPFSDFFDWIKLKFKTFEISLLFKFILLIFVMAVPLTRMYKQYQRKKNHESLKFNHGQKLMTDIYKIIKNTDLEKQPSETLQEWLIRINKKDYVFYVNESVYGLKVHQDKIKDLKQSIEEDLKQRKMKKA